MLTHVLQATSAPVVLEGVPILRDGPLVTPRPPDFQLDAIPAISRKKRASRQTETAQSPYSFGRSFSSFLRFCFAKERRGHDARNRGFGPASCSRDLVFLRGTLLARRAEDWCSQRAALQTQMPNEATDGLAPSGFGLFSGAVRADSRGFSPTSEEDPRRQTAGSNSRRAPEAWCTRTGALQRQIPAWLFTLLSKTPPTEWCYSGNPYLIFTLVPFVVCRGRRVIFLRGAVYMMAEKATHFQDYRVMELIMSSPGSSTHKRIGRGVCNVDSTSGDREKQKRRVIWYLQQIHAKSRYEKPPFEL